MKQVVFVQQQHQSVLACCLSTPLSALAGHFLYLHIAHHDDYDDDHDGDNVDDNVDGDFC